MKPRAGTVFVRGIECGRVEEVDRGAGFRFSYFPEYLADPGAPSVSLTLPRRTKPYVSSTLFPFFSGLLAEGDLREMQCRKFRIDPNDEFGLLLGTCGEDVIGAVTVVEAEKK